MLSNEERVELEALKNDPAVKYGRQLKRKKVDKEKQLLYTLRYLKKLGEKALKEEIQKWTI